VPPGLQDHAWFNPGGLAVLWAEENSRLSLFAAMRRREAYGTSGPRILLRTFGGWSLDDGLCEAMDFAEQGYANGVPMGGQLPARGDGAAPVFAVRAQRDPGTASLPGGLLSHLQMVKGWVDGDEVHTRIYDIAGNADNGATVDVQTCERQGDGADALCTVWTDPDFDPTQPAFYYVRVLENPSCRWHTYACNAGGVNCDEPETITERFEPCCDSAWPKTHRERAWSSPIWYRPE
jgi:hypothetical protein